MIVKTGIDILSRSRFSKSFNSSEAFKYKIFTQQELGNNTPQQLASIFCLKESIIKALGLKSASWLMISTSRLENGKVVCSFLDPDIASKIESFDTSISHEKDFIVTTATFILK